MTEQTFRACQPYRYDLLGQKGDRVCSSTTCDSKSSRLGLHPRRSCLRFLFCAPWRASDHPSQAARWSRHPNFHRAQHRRRRRARLSSMPHSTWIAFPGVIVWLSQETPSQSKTAAGRVHCLVAWEKQAAWRGWARQHSAHPCHLIEKQTAALHHPSRFGSQR